MVKRSALTILILSYLLSASFAVTAGNESYLYDLNFFPETEVITPFCEYPDEFKRNNCLSEPSLFLVLNDQPENPPIQSDIGKENKNENTYNSWLNESISTEPDWEGLKRDTQLFLFYQFFIIGILYVMPEDLSGWSEEVKETWEFDNYRKNLAHVTWDRDKWWINYILHPYWGGTYYVRARNRGYDQQASVWYSVLLSTLYEFGSEALFERASAQDLIVTPLGGYFFGEYMMKARGKVREKMAAKAELTAYDKTLMVVSDPLGWINYKTSHFLGLASKLSIKPISGLKIAGNPDFYIQKSPSHHPDTGKDRFSHRPLDFGFKASLNW